MHSSILHTVKPMIMMRLSCCVLWMRYVSCGCGHRANPMPCGRVCGRWVLVGGFNIVDPIILWMRHLNFICMLLVDAWLASHSSLVDRSLIWFLVESKQGFS